LKIQCPAAENYNNTESRERRQDRRIAAKRRLGEIEREMERLVDAIAKGHGDPPILGARINELKSERIQLAAEVAAMSNSQKVVTLHPGLLARYEQQVENNGASDRRPSARGRGICYL
jgi:site-specific DNA recombinase